MTWNVHLSRNATKQLRKLPRDAQKQIARAVESLKKDPFAGDSKVLKGPILQRRYRRRVGRYRLFFIPHSHPKNPRLTITAILLRSEKTYRR